MKVAWCNMDLNFADIFQWVLIQNAGPRIYHKSAITNGYNQLDNGTYKKIANNIFSMRKSLLR